MKWKIQNEVKNTKWSEKWSEKWSAKILFIIYSRIFFFYEWSVLGQIRSEKMKWENEVKKWSEKMKCKDSIYFLF